MIWVLFILLIFGLLALDLGVFHKKEKVVTIKESLAWTAVWVFIALSFGGVVYWLYDTNFLNINPHQISASKATIEYFSGYLIEESLSLDNIFVIALIFIYFKIDAKFQHNILFWGIIGAIFFRLIMILLGTTFVESFEWSMYVFGGILIYSAIRMLIPEKEEKDFKDSLAIKLLEKIYPIDWEMNHRKYIIIKNGKRMATGLLAALVVVEFSDILFAVDSIPAIFSITKDPFIVFTSNIFAILGLRNLFFFLSGMMNKFQYIKYSLVLILLFVGIKMIIEPWVHLSPLFSLIFILSSLLLGIFVSIIIKTENN
ncbi:MAG: TerC/Alx family metal homeostasis membrane protein [Flavobacteriia bacterium]|nr:TerC/Alx family metal homeostasis membrane protein [Flavobacteriia bacterium]